MSADIIDQDLGFDKFFDDVKELTSMGTIVGYDQTSGDVDGFAILDLALTHEMGNDRIPARPFVRGSFDNNVDEIGDTGEKLADRFLDGKIDAALTHEIWGDSVKTLVQNGVITRSLGLEANAPETISRKGSDTPLIDTGRMISAIGVTVKK